MSVTSKYLSLSALNPIQLTYKQQADSAIEEKLNSEHQTYQEGIRTYKHEALTNVRDAAFSKKTVLILTSIKDLKDVFSSTLTNSENLLIAGSCKLMPFDNPLLNGDTAIKQYQNELFVGGKGEDVVFTIVPTEEKWVELKVGSKYLEVSNEYPYTIKLATTKTLSKHNYYFEVDFYGNAIAFKKATDTGIRFLSYSQIDRQFRCVGMQLNRVIINQYLFDATFYNTPTFLYGYDPTNFEVKYFNSIERGVEARSLNIKEKQQHDSNLLISSPLYDLIDEKAAANISLLKTNFSAGGSYNISI